MKKLIFLLSLFFLAGCGGTHDDIHVPAATYQIGVLAPISSGNTEFGLGIRNSAQLAVDKWNDNHQPYGPFFELAVFNDSSDPDVGLAAAQQMVESPNLVGVVGTYNSGVAHAVLPTFQQAHLALLSPGNTDPSLTLGSDLNHPRRPYSNYFRLVVPDTLQGPALAEYAFRELGLTKVAVLTEAKAVSQGLADAFSVRFQELGGTITSTQVAPDGTNDYRTLLGLIVPTAPQLLFYAGEVPQASIVRDQATELGLTVAMMGGDGMKSQDYIDDATVATAGDIASSVGAPAELLNPASAYLAAYAAAGFTDPPSNFGPYAFDAANLIMQATLTGNGTRESVIDALQATNTQGITGKLAFDHFGDTLNKILTIYIVENGIFAPEQIINLSTTP